MSKIKKPNQPTKATLPAESKKSPTPVTAQSPAVMPIAQVAGKRGQAKSLAHHESAGVRLLQHPRFKQTQLQFDRKLPAAIAQRLRQAGWTWRPAEGVYTRQFGSLGEAAAIAEARRLYEELCRELADQLVSLTD